MTMLDTVDAPAELPLDTAGKRALIEKELRENPQRSDRAIAAAVGNGICHKTVGAARERLGIASPLGNSAEQPRTAAEAIARAAAGEKVNFPTICPPPPGVVDEPKWDPFAPDSEDMVIHHQPAIAVYENTVGAVVIRQVSDDPDERDPVIQVRPEHVEKLIARLRKVAAEARQS